MKRLLTILPICAALCGCLAPAAAQERSQREQLAVQYYKNQEYEKAVALFGELFREQPDNYCYSYYLPCLLETGNFREAEKVVQRQIRQYPKLQRFPVDLGWVYEKEGNATKAQRQYERCIEGAKSAQALKELSAAFLNYGLTEQAIQCYGRIRSMTGEPSAYAFELAMLHRQRGDYPQALQELLHWAAEHPSAAEVSSVESELTTWMTDDEDKSRHTLVGKTLLQYANKNPDVPVYAHLMLWFTLQEEDYPAALKQAIAIDKRFQGEGRKTYEIATIAADNKDYGTAIAGYDHIRKNCSEFSPCYEAALSGSIHTRYLQITGQYPPDMFQIRQLSVELDSFFRQHPLRDAHLATYLNWVEIEAVYQKEIPKAIGLLEKAVSSPGLSAKGKAACKLQLGDIYHLEDEIWEATLLYSQVEKDFPNDTIGQNAKFKNAKLAFYMGEFEWAKAQLEVLRAATSKMIANDAMQLSLLIADNESGDSIDQALHLYARAEYYFTCKEFDKATKTLDSINESENPSLTDDILYLRAEMAIQRQQYAEADRLLERIATQFPEELLGDDALFRRAHLQEERLNDPLTAMDLYQQLLKQYPDCLYAPEARKRFRALRNNGMPQP
ncbi:MAG: tetratricopeptide repeat protein [Bacteroidales bacterium]|nr:tetratricopeptide repeat protein [Bacteroidales bacterium]